MDNICLPAVICCICLKGSTKGLHKDTKAEQREGEPLQHGGEVGC